MRQSRPERGERTGRVHEQCQQLACPVLVESQTGWRADPFSEGVFHCCGTSISVDYNLVLLGTGIPGQVCTAVGSEIYTLTYFSSTRNRYITTGMLCQIVHMCLRYTTVKTRQIWSHSIFVNFVKVATDISYALSRLWRGHDICIISYMYIYTSWLLHRSFSGAVAVIFDILYTAAAACEIYVQQS